MAQGSSNAPRLRRGAPHSAIEPAVDINPSSLKRGQQVHVMTPDMTEEIRGVVVDTMENGAFVGPTNEHGVRKIQRPLWCCDDQWFVNEVDGHAVF
jgi:hypothetical protein